VVYICISEHVVLRLYIHVIFVDGLHQKIGETLPNFLAKEHVCSTPIASSLYNDLSFHRIIYRLFQVNLLCIQI
jgi:hypothetical protein